MMTRLCSRTMVTLTSRYAPMSCPAGMGVACNRRRTPNSRMVIIIVELVSRPKARALKTSTPGKTQLMKLNSSGAPVAAGVKTVP